LTVVCTVACTGLAGLAATAAADSPDAAGTTVVLTLEPGASAAAVHATAVAIRDRIREADVGAGEVTAHRRRITLRLDTMVDAELARALVTPPTIEFRRVLASLPSFPASPGSESRTARDAVAACDTSAIAGLPAVPTTAFVDYAAEKCVALRAPGGGAAPRVLLGPVVLDGDAVKHADRTFVSGAGNVVDLTLTRTGLRAFNELAAQLFRQPSPTDEIAMVSDRTVVATPAFQSATFEGTVQISGNFSAADARELASTAGGAGWPVRIARVRVGPG
jgi:preprotein translocase subunit SecD